jgi:hypothetical protein
LDKSKVNCGVRSQEWGDREVGRKKLIADGKKNPYPLIPIPYPLIPIPYPLIPTKRLFDANPIHPF